MSVGRSFPSMKITATYIAEDETYIVEVGEKQIVVPATSMSRFVSCVEAALYRQRLAANQRKAERARKLIEEANHPAVLPFVQEKPETAQPEPKHKGRPKGIHTPKSRLKPKPPPKPPKEPEPPPFRHTPFR